MDEGGRDEYRRYRAASRRAGQGAMLPDSDRFCDMAMTAQEGQFENRDGRNERARIYAGPCNLWADLRRQARESIWIKIIISVCCVLKATCLCCGPEGPFVGD